LTRLIYQSTIVTLPLLSSPLLIIHLDLLYSSSQSTRSEDRGESCPISIKDPGRFGISSTGGRGWRVTIDIAVHHSVSLIKLYTALVYYMYN